MSPAAHVKGAKLIVSRMVGEIDFYGRLYIYAGAALLALLFLAKIVIGEDEDAVFI